ncbi:MAG TPA: enoyl-CoA hydratase, partial [Asanoa sp.]|nr:enoyl-CoA hydratase [Asanoa sp.]
DAGTLGDALAAEAQAQTIAGATADHRNATVAFVEKRKPTFEGR